MSVFAEIVKSALGAAVSSGQAESQSRDLLTGAMQMLDSMGGVNGLVNKFQQSGLGDLAASWVGTGENKQINPDQLASVLGKDKIAALAQQAGIPESEGASVLSKVLPEMVNKLTPDGDVPESSNLATWGKVLLGGIGVAAAATAAATYFGNKEGDESAATAAAPQSSGGSAPVGMSSSSTAPPPAPASDAQTYTVVSGDTLSKIAKQFYQDAGQWPRIFEANRDILSNPDRISPGQKLRIP